MHYFVSAIIPSLRISPFFSQDILQITFCVPLYNDLTKKPKQGPGVHLILVLQKLVRKPSILAVVNHVSLQLQIDGLKKCPPTYM